MAYMRKYCVFEKVFADLSRGYRRSVYLYVNSDRFRMVQDIIRTVVYQGLNGAMKVLCRGWRILWLQIFGRGGVYLG